MEDQAYLTANPVMPNECVEINPELCIGCNSCVDVCRSDLLIPNEKKGKPTHHSSLGKRYIVKRSAI